MGRKVKPLIASVILVSALVVILTLGLWQKQEPPPPTTPTTTPTTTPAGNLHTSLWSMVVEKSKVDRYYLCGIYASRVLTVMHPELYLQADDLFLTTVMSNTGYQKAYQIKNVTDDYFLSSLSGPPFSFKLVDFKAYKAVPCSELYPKDYPILPYLDRRMLTIASTLKLAGGNISQLELAEQYYFSLKELGNASKGLYIIYCDNENAYVLSDDSLTFMANLKKTEGIEGNPVLIFNEEDVWYPLMERDDSSREPVLRNIVKKFSTTIQTPKLTEAEENILLSLRVATNLTNLSQDQNMMIKLAAAHSEGVVGSYTEFSTCWNKLGIPSSGGHGFFRAFNRVGNYLSPITARLATLSEDLEGLARLKAISDEYTTYTATRFYKTARLSWGHSWPCELAGNTVDETYRTRGSHCVWQATNFASVLDAIGIDNYIVEQCPKRGNEPYLGEWGLHTIVYVPKYDLVLGLGVIETVVYLRLNTVVSYTPENESRTVIRFLGYRDKWAYPTINGYYGTLSPNESSSIIKQLKSAHNDTIEGVSFQSGRLRVVSFLEHIEGLQAEQLKFKPPRLP